MWASVTADALFKFSASPNRYFRTRCPPGRTRSANGRVEALSALILFRVSSSAPLFSSAPALFAAPPTAAATRRGNSRISRAPAHSDGQVEPSGAVVGGRLSGSTLTTDGGCARLQSFAMVCNVVHYIFDRFGPRQAAARPNITATSQGRRDHCHAELSRPTPLVQRTIGLRIATIPDCQGFKFSSAKLKWPTIKGEVEAGEGFDGGIVIPEHYATGGSPVSSAGS
jgi:hypothetical protein